MASTKDAGNVHTASPFDLLNRIENNDAGGRISLSKSNNEGRITIPSMVEGRLASCVLSHDSLSPIHKRGTSLALDLGKNWSSHLAK